jgi:Fe2+ transport system protein FeoA
MQGKGEIMTKIPLIDLKEGESGRIVEIFAGRGFRMRLTEMGFDKGSRITVVRKSGYGPIIVEVKGCCRIALGRGEASKIMVEVE